MKHKSWPQHGIGYNAMQLPNRSTRSYGADKGGKGHTVFKSIIVLSPWMRFSYCLVEFFHLSYALSLLSLQHSCRPLCVLATIDVRGRIWSVNVMFHAACFISDKRTRYLIHSPPMVWGERESKRVKFGKIEPNLETALATDLNKCAVARRSNWNCVV